MHWIGIASPFLTAFVSTKDKKAPTLLQARVESQVRYSSSTPFDESSSSSESLLSSSTTTIDLSKYNDLMEWIRSKEGAKIHPGISIAPSQLGDGYGVFVIEDIEPNEVLFTIPRSACITLDDATSDPISGQDFRELIEKAGPGGNTVVLAGFLARERLRSLQHQESPDSVKDSSFGPYLETLPWERGVNNQEHVLFWVESKVMDLLPGSMCWEEVAALREEVDLAIRVLNGIVGSTIRQWREGGDQAVEKATGGGGGFEWPWERAAALAAEKEMSKQMVELLPEAIKGAFVCLLTRSFQDDTQQQQENENDPEKLVPLLDLLQHVDEPNISHFMQASTGAVQVVARQPLAAGEELLNQYRSELEETMPYHRFFSRFGFVPGIAEPMENLFQDKSSIFFAQKAEV